MSHFVPPLNEDVKQVEKFMTVLNTQENAYHFEMENHRQA